MLTAIAGFLIPEQYIVMSGAAPYHTFHLAFGAIGLVLMSSKNDLVASSFNLGFGWIVAFSAFWIASHSHLASAR